MKKLLPIFFFIMYCELSCAQPNLLWSDIYSTKSYGDDEAKFIHANKDSTITVAGSTSLECGSYQATVIKYDLNGNIIWQYMVDDSMYPEDGYLRDFVTDKYENYYLAIATSYSFNYVFKIIKLNKNGKKISDFNLGSVGYYAAKMYADDSGHVYFAGNDNSAWEKTYVNKFDSTGNLMWTYNYPSNQSSYPFSILSDAQNNIIVCGIEYISFNKIKIAVIKLDEAGNVLWTNDSLIPYGGGSYENYPVILSDSLSNIYIGTSNYIVASAEEDAVLSKIDPNGNILWSKYHHGTKDETIRAMTFDKDGNIYMTGLTHTNGSLVYPEPLVIKYHPDGTLVYAKTFPVNNFSEIGYAINYDSSSNHLFLVTEKSPRKWNGYFYMYGNSRQMHVYKLDTAANILDSGFYNNPVYYYDMGEDLIASSVCINGKLFIAAVTSDEILANLDFTTLCFDKNCNVSWVKKINSNGSSNSNAIDMQQDNSGNTIVCGNINRGNYEEIYAYKLNSSGTKQWEFLYKGGQLYNYQSTAMTIDAAGNTYLCGVFDSSYSYYRVKKWVTLKLDNNGQLLWARSFGGSLENKNNSNHSISIDNAGNVLVAGFTTNLHSKTDATIICYDNYGTLKWVNQFDENHNISNYLDLICDKDANVYGVGYTSDSVGYHRIYNNALVTKTNSSGQILWETKYDSDTLSSRTHDQFNHILLGNNQLIVCGSSEGKAITAAYDLNGKLVWKNTHKYGTEKDSVSALAIDKSGNIISAGAINPSYNTTFFVDKFNPDGKKLWSVQLLDTCREGYISSISTDDEKNIFLTCVRYLSYSQHGKDFTDSYLYRLDANGILKWQISDLNTNGNFANNPFKMKRVVAGKNNSITVMADKQKECYYDGHFANETNVFKYSPETEPPLVSNGYPPLIFPNPASASFTVAIDKMHLSKEIEFTLFDITGKKILTRELLVKQTEIPTSDLSQGVYMYSVSGLGQTYYGKIVIIQQKH